LATVTHPCLHARTRNNIQAAWTVVWRKARPLASLAGLVILKRLNHMKSMVIFKGLSSRQCGECVEAASSKQLQNQEKSYLSLLSTLSLAYLYSCIANGTRILGDIYTIRTKPVHH